MRGVVFCLCFAVCVICFAFAWIVAFVCGCFVLLLVIALQELSYKPKEIKKKPQLLKKGLYVCIGDWVSYSESIKRGLLVTVKHV